MQGDRSPIFIVPVRRRAWQGGVVKSVLDRPVWGRGRTTRDGSAIHGRDGSAMPLCCADDTYEDMEFMMWGLVRHCALDASLAPEEWRVLMLHDEDYI